MEYDDMTVQQLLDRNIALMRQKEKIREEQRKLAAVLDAKMNPGQPKPRVRQVIWPTGIETEEAVGQKSFWQKILWFKRR